MDLRSVGFALVFAAVAGCSGSAQTDRQQLGSGGQTAGVPDLTVQQAAKIPPVPPRDVTVTASDGKRVVSWELSPLESIVRYRVYRKAASQEKYEKIAEVLAPPFSDKNAAASTDYAVTSVNSYGTESALATPDKKNTRKAVPDQK